MTSPALPTVVFVHASNEMYGSDRSLLNLVRVSVAVCRPIICLPSDIAYKGQLYAALREQGVDVLVGPVVVMRRGYLRPFALLKWLLSSARGLWWMLRVVQRYKPTVVVSNTSAVPGGPAVAWILRLRHIWYLREIVRSPRWFRGLIRRLARLPAGVVVTNSRAVDDWLGGLSGRPVVVIHNSVDADGPVAPLPSQATAVYVGRLTHGKGWDLFVEAAAQVHRRIPASRFVLAGGPAPGSLSSVADIRAMLEQVDPTATWLTWIGEVERPRDLLRQAWVAVIPSRTAEGLGNVALEAMAEGRAVVGSNAGGIRETVIDDRTGILVPPDDVPALTKALERLLSDPGLSQRMGTAGRELVTTAFSGDRLTREWLDLLGREIDLGRPGSR